MPTSSTPDDTPAWIKGDLPADASETGADPLPVEAGDSSPDALETDEPGRDEDDNRFGDTADLLPDPREGASPDPYDVRDSATEPAAAPDEPDSGPHDGVEALGSRQPAAIDESDVIIEP